MDSLRIIAGDEERAANAKGQVDDRAEQRQTEVIADAYVNHPALFDFLHPKPELPHHDRQHAHADGELHVEHRDVDEDVSCLSVPCIVIETCRAFHSIGEY